VDEDVYSSTWGVLEEGREDGHIGCEISFDVAGLDIENVYEDSDIGEYVDALLGKVVLHECLLPAAVPQVECKVA
jgi:hypothetical protein